MSIKEIESVLHEIRKRYSFKVILMTYNEGVEEFKLGQLSQMLYDAILCVDKILPKGDFSGLVHTLRKIWTRT